MGKHNSIGELTKKRLAQRYPLRQKDLGADAHLKKSGFAFDTEAYAVEGVGHLCVMRMKAMLGLMQMETVVLSVQEKDLPLFNLDWVGAAGKETQIVELYDTQLAPWPEAAQAPFAALSARDADLADYSSGKAHWYDAILYPCSYHKTGKGVSERLFKAAADSLDAYLAQLEAAPACGADEKRAKVRAFAEELFAQGGPAVDQMVKLFGRETAGRVILQAMYGV